MCWVHSEVWLMPELAGTRKRSLPLRYLHRRVPRIADIISRPPDEWESRETGMEFAYLQDNQMQIDKMSNIVRLRRDFNVFKGV